MWGCENEICDGRSRGAESLFAGVETYGPQWEEAKRLIRRVHNQSTLIKVELCKIGEFELMLMFGSPTVAMSDVE